MEILRSVCAGWPRPGGAPGPGATGPALSWIGDERIVISGVPSAWAVACLALVLRYRTEAQLVPAYVRSVERWLATAAR